MAHRTDRAPGGIAHDHPPRTARWKAYHPFLRNILTPLLFVWFAYVCAQTYILFAAPQSLSLMLFRYIARGLPGDIDLLILLLAFLFSAIGPGALIVRVLRLPWQDRWEKALFSLATGLVLYTFGFFAIGALGFLRHWVCSLILAGGLILSALQLLQPYLLQKSRSRHPVDTARSDQGDAWSPVVRVWLALVLLLFLYIALLGSLSPETEFDARWYHLGPARAYAREETFINYVQVTNMRAAGLDVYQVVLYTVLWKFDGMTAAKMLHWGYAFLTTLGIVQFCRAFLRSSTSGLLAALIYISTPLIGWSAGTGGNDLQLCFFTLLAIYAFLRWREDVGAPNWLLLAGVLSGFALGSKWNGMISMLVIGGAIALLSIFRFARVRAPGALRQLFIPTLLYGAGAIAACLPWLARAYYMTGNPLFPYFTSIFPSPYSLPGAQVGAAEQKPSLHPLIVTIIDSLTIHDQYRGLLGPVFIFMVPVCLVSLAFFTPRVRAIMLLLTAFVVVWLLLWYEVASLEIRYAETLIPILAILSAGAVVGIGWQRWRGRFLQSALVLMLGLLIASNFYPFIPFQRGAGVANAFAQPRIAWAYLYEGAPEESVQLQYIPMISYINAHLSSEHDKVYDTSGLILYASYSDVLFYSGTPFIDGSPGWDLLTPDAMRHLAAIGATYISMTASTVEQLKQRPIGGCLDLVNQTPDDQYLFRVEYPRVSDSTSSRCEK